MQGGEKADRGIKKPPLLGEVARRSRDGEVVTNLRQPLSQPAADSIPTPFVPSGHFPLIGGIGPWKGSLCPLRRGNLSGAARQLPLTRGALGAGVEKPPLDKGSLGCGRGKASPCQGEVPSGARRRGSGPSQLQLPCGVFVGGLVVLKLAAGELHGLAELALEELGQGAEGVGLAEVFRGGLILLLFAG